MMRCALCGEPVEAGDLDAVEVGGTALVHSDCLREHDAERRSRAAPPRSRGRERGNGPGKKENGMTDLRGVYVFTPTGVGGHGLGAFLVDGKLAAFTTPEKADAFRRTHKELLKGMAQSLLHHLPERGLRAGSG